MILFRKWGIKPGNDPFLLNPSPSILSVSTSVPSHVDIPFKNEFTPHPSGLI